VTSRRGSPKPVAFAIDAGGTKVQAAFVAADGGVTDHVVAPADWSDQGGAMVEQILALATGAVRRRPDVAASSRPTAASSPPALGASAGLACPWPNASARQPAA
jgi:hypothetical protein